MTRLVWVVSAPNEQLFLLGRSAGTEAAVYLTRVLERARQYPIVSWASDEISMLNVELEFRDDEDMLIPRPTFEVRQVKITLELL